MVILLLRLLLLWLWGMPLQDRTESYGLGWVCIWLLGWLLKYANRGIGMGAAERPWPHQYFNQRGVARIVLASLSCGCCGNLFCRE